MVCLLFSLPPLALLGSVFLLCHKGRCRSETGRIMVLMLMVLAISMAFYAQYYNPYVIASHSWWADFLFRLFSAICAPVYFVFLNRLTNIRRTPALNVVVFLPTVIYGTMLVNALIIMNDAERYAFICNVVYGQDARMSSLAYDWMMVVGSRIYRILIPVQTVMVLIYGEFRLNSYVRLIDEYNSSMETGGVTRIHGTHLLAILVAVLCLFVSIIPVYQIIEHVWLAYLAVLTEVVIVALIVSNMTETIYTASDIHSMIENGIASSANEDKPLDPDVESTPSLIARIDSVMVKEHLYLRPDLSLVTLAEHVGTNRTYVSKAIKDAKGCNFPDYVNRYRLDYALTMMKNLPKDKIIMQNIALQCGCGSIQTFYRCFKLFFSETPTQWIERNK